MRTLDLDQYWPGAGGAGKPAEPDNGAAVAADRFTARDAVFTKAGGHLPAQPIAAVRDSWTPIIWGGLGFVAGMLAWHVIGFWSFVSDVTFNDHARTATASSGSPQRSAADLSHKPNTRSDNPSNRNCVALAIDRASGDAIPGACPADDKPLADAGRTPRDDLAFSKPRLQDPQIWAGVTAVEPEISPEPIDESAFDLTIRPGP